jgi:enoyl-CoA hydratase
MQTRFTATSVASAAWPGMRVVGMHLPGDLGLASSWKINFNNPLYVDEQAIIHAELSHISPATHTVKIKFHVTSGDKLIASGTAGSKILDE